jgi:hypothetical protein
VPSRASDLLQKAIEALPAGESEFITEMLGRVDTSKFIPSEYGIG